MITSINVAKEAIKDMEYLKAWCKENGVSKSWLVMKLVSAWVEKEKNNEQS